MAKLDQYLANLAVGNVKLHNLHWNLEGIHFKATHEYLETLYEDGFEYLDEVAELQKMLGQQPLSTMQEFLDNATLEEFKKHSFTDKEAIELGLDYVVTMKDLAYEVRAEADEKDQFPISNMMEDHIEEYLKHEWFLKSMLEEVK